MREIKFRGKKDNSRVWDFGNYAISKDGKSFLVNIGKDNIGYIAYLEEVNKDTIGRYTGLKDKRDREIYEGDIIKFNEQIGEVVFENGTFGIGFNDYIKWERLEWNYKDSQIDDNILPVCYNDHFISFAEIYSICDDFDDVIVIGNIYDNKDLLGDTK